MTLTARSDTPRTSATAVFDWLDRDAARRWEAGLTRTPHVRAQDESLLDLASNDYLGLARHPQVREAAIAAVRTWGAGATGSRLVTGTTSLHRELEDELADFYGVEAALVLSSGYAANLAALTALTRPDTLIVSEEHNHASLIDGCRLTRAKVVITPHRKVDAVAGSLRERAGALVVTESVFSVDGDRAPLTELHAVAREHGAALIVDDAHGLGVIGGGAGAFVDSGLVGAPDAVATATLSKAFGTQGGVVLGPRRVIEHLLQTARTFIFDTGLAPASVAAGLAALRLIRAEPQRSDRVREVATALHSRLTAAGIEVSNPGAAVIGIPVGDPERAVRWAHACRERGVFVGCFRPPSVPDTASRLRLTARADLSEEQIDRAVRVIARTAPSELA